MISYHLLNSKKGVCTGGDCPVPVGVGLGRGRELVAKTLSILFYRSTMGDKAIFRRFDGRELYLDIVNDHVDILLSKSGAFFEAGEYLLCVIDRSGTRWDCGGMIVLTGSSDGVKTFIIAPEDTQSELKMLALELDAEKSKRYLIEARMDKLEQKLERLVDGYDVE